MESSNPSGRSYWDLLGDALRHLDAGDLPAAERHFDLALAERSHSPGRVFLTEKLADGLTNLIKGRGRSRPGGKAPTADGRWSRKAGDFRRRFLIEGERVVREAVRLAELRPEDDAESNQPILETALFLVGRSRLFSEEPSSAVPLLKGLFRTAGKTGRPFDAQLIRHDIPLTEEDRLWLARKGPEVLEEFVANGELQPGSPESGLWVQVILQLLNPRYFGSAGRLAEERAWLEAVTTDRLLKQPHESIELYRGYLQENPEPGVRSDEARIRLLELLANIEGTHFPVPRYAEALGAMQAAGLASGSAASDRFQLALDRIEYRRPDPEPGHQSAAWASVGLESDGKVAVVFWWKNEPRDVAFWSTGDDPEAMVRYLEPCGDRIVATEPAVVEAVGTAWESTPAVWSVRDFACAFLETSLPESGLDDDILLKIGLGESGPWRSGWKPDLGHPLLDPPRRSALVETWRGGAASGALLGGLVWQAILARIENSDPALRAGIGAMARRADPAADFLYDFLNLDQDVAQSIDSSFEPWTLPLLWTRPDPFGFAAPTGSGPAAAQEAENRARPDLGHNDLAIVATGDPGAVLAAWGDGRRKWRVALDRLDRLADLARVAVKAIGPVTLIPAGGQVHCLRACLDLLEHLLSRSGRPAGRVDGLLPLFHWLRLVETHNGDVLDFLQLRPRAQVPIALFTSYQDLVGDLEMVEPVLESADEDDPWATQFSQRVRKAGLVAGLADGLTLDPQRLDSLWGVFEGSDVSWVFLDSAAIHWHLLARQGVGIQELHALLHTRGSRHLSMLVGAVWMRSELEDLLGTWLGVYGSPYCLALTNMHPPLLRLADRGVAPDAVQLSLEAHASGVAQVAESIELAGSGTVLLPARGSHRDLWRRIADGEIGLGRKNWNYLDPGQDSDTALPAQKGTSLDKLLLVPVLDSLADSAVPIAQEDTREAWTNADQDRASYLIWRRRLCGLEIASLLAGPWETVEVMDCRWWRILEAEVSEPGPAAAWSGDRALAAAAVDGCRLFNLPQVGSGSGGTIHPNTLEAVRHWLAGRKQAPSQASVTDYKLPAEPRVILALHEPERIWDSLVLPVVKDWEKGQLSSWLLLVSDWAPSSAAAVVAAGFSPGISVWAGERTSRRPAPVLWCSAADLEDPDLKNLLKESAPACALVLEVDRWLPSADRTGQHGATALRTLLDSPAGRLVLQAEKLSAPWCSFLAREAQALVLGEPAGESAQALSDHSTSPFLPRQAVLPDAGQALSPEVIVRRMHRLLDNLKPALGLAQSGAPGAGENASPGRQLVSLDRLSVLSGLPAQQIASGFRVLRWVARLAGDSLSDAEAAGAGRHQEARGHTLLIPRRFADLEHQLTELEEQLAVLFPLMLGEHRPGLPTWFDLEYPPVQLEPGQLDLIDSFLASLSRSSGEGLGLIYQCPRGKINTTRRLVGATAPPAEVLGRIQKAIHLFRSRLADVMGSAVETGEGFLVETGLQQLRKDEQDFLALGTALGLWSWSGPAIPGALHVVDLLTTAGSSTVRLGTSGWDLLEQELELLVPASGSASRAGSPGARGAGEEDRDRWRVGGLKSLFTGAGKADELDLAADRVAALASPGGDPGLLVLSGLAGTGRHQALARGLQRARNQAGFAGEITVYCPDHASAAHFLQQGDLTGEWNGTPEIRVVGSKQGLPRPNRNRKTGDPGSDAVVVMLEVHRFEAEIRYQIAQLGRGRRLLMTTDPAASTEPWEHLFLTIPRASEVLRLETQRTLARRVWSDVRMLLPEGLRGREKSLAPGKGNINAVYAVNLDQCLARMVQEVEEGTLPQRFRLVGPLTSDLDFLATSLRERGWLAVAEQRLDAALLPGPREVLAAVTLAAGQLGLLAGALGTEARSEPATGDDSEPPVQPVLSALMEILSRCLGPEARAALEPWRESCRDLDPATTLGDFLADLEAWPWARSVLSDPQAAARAVALIEPWAGRSLADLKTFALWEAWLYSSFDTLNAADVIRRRPLVTLTESGQASGSPAAAGVYLCLGTELPRQHYNILSRITCDVLILYKERSPLAAEAAD